MCIEMRSGELLAGLWYTRLAYARVDMGEYLT